MVKKDLQILMNCQAASWISFLKGHILRIEKNIKEKHKRTAYEPGHRNDFSEA